MKTLHLTNHFHRASGGIGVFYQALFKAAPELGHEMVLIASAERDATEKINDFVKVHYVASPRAPFFDRRYRLIWPTSYLFDKDSRLRKLLVEEKPDLIEIGDKYTLCWLAGLIRRGLIKGLDRPLLVGTSHERMDDNVRAFLTTGRVGQALSRLYLGHLYLPLFDQHLANSTYTAAELETAVVDHHRRPVEVIPMGVDLDHLPAAGSDTGWRKRMLVQIGGGRAARLLIYIGRLSPEKNVGLLIEVMERLQDEGNEEFHLLIAGAGPLEGWLRDECRRRVAGRIHLLGHLTDRQELARLLASGDAFIHPNPREPFGIAPLEAMAAGVPLVAPRAGGIITYANTENAWLCEPDASDFAATIRSLFANPEERGRRIAEARQTAGRYRWPVIARLHLQRYEQLWRDFAGRSGPGRSSTPSLAQETFHSRPGCTLGCRGERP